jgi:hypothetical protein
VTPTLRPLQLPTRPAQCPGRLLGLPRQVPAQLGEGLVEVDEALRHPGPERLDGGVDVVGAVFFGDGVHGVLSSFPSPPCAFLSEARGYMSKGSLRT